MSLLNLLDQQEPTIWLERYDWLWKRIGFICYASLSLLLPVALSFGVIKLVWVWWAFSVVMAFYSLWGWFTKGDKRGIITGIPVITANQTTIWFVIVLAGFMLAFEETIVATKATVFGLSCLAFLIMFSMSWPFPNPITLTATVIFFIGAFVDLLELCGIRGSVTVARVWFCISLFVSVICYPLRYQRVQSSMLRFFEQFMKPTRRLFSIEIEDLGRDAAGLEYLASLTYIYRIFTAVAFYSYLMLCPGITDHICSGPALGLQWFGWVAMVIFYTLASLPSVSCCLTDGLSCCCCCGGDGGGDTDPLTAAKRLEFELPQQLRKYWAHDPAEQSTRWFGHRDLFVENMCLIFANVFVWEMLRCALSKSTAGMVICFLCSGLVALTYFVGFRCYAYQKLCRQTICSAIVRFLPVCFCVSFLTLVVVGPVFEIASYMRWLDSCRTVRVGTIPIGDNYKETFTGPREYAPGQGPRFNATLLVGLHNSYHQKSVLSSIVQSWDYSHPSMYDQLSLGFREIELDVHFPRNADDFKVFHVKMFDQKTSCSCLSDCLRQIRRFMDEQEAEMAVAYAAVGYEGQYHGQYQEETAEQGYEAAYPAPLGGSLGGSPSAHAHAHAPRSGHVHAHKNRYSSSRYQQRGQPQARTRSHAPPSPSPYYRRPVSMGTGLGSSGSSGSKRASHHPAALDGDDDDYFTSLPGKGPTPATRGRGFRRQRGRERQRPRRLDGSLPHKVPRGVRHSPILVHIEPRGYVYHDLFCKRSDGKQRFEELQQEIFDMFWDKIYFPDELTVGFPNMWQALQRRGWPAASSLRGRIIFNLNLFSSNMACKPIYWEMGGASHADRLAKSEGLYELADAEGATIGARTKELEASGNRMALTRKRKVFFNRGTIAEAKMSLTTASMEVSAGSPQSDFDSGFITRFRVGNVPEGDAFILAKHKIIPSTLVTYDGVWPG